MSIAEQFLPRKRPLRLTAPSENILLVIVASALLAVHVGAGAWASCSLPHNPADQKEIMMISRGD